MKSLGIASHFVTGEAERDGLVEFARTALIKKKKAEPRASVAMLCREKRTELNVKTTPEADD